MVGSGVDSEVDCDVDLEVDCDVDLEVESDVGSGSPMPRTAEDFAFSEVVVGGASAVVLCGGS